MPLAVNVYDALRAAILRGDYPFGAHLGEVELAKSLGTSRTPVREALRLLTADGLVTALPNKGVRVASWTGQDLNEIYELRALLEGYGARQAAPRIDLPMLDHLDELCDEMQMASRPGPEQDLDLLSKLNTEFHRAIYIASDNDRLEGLIETLVKIPLVLSTFSRYSGEDLERSQKQHSELVLALRHRDGMWAESVMKAHILSARSVLVDSLDSGSES